jgi:hypothetical protein
MDEPKKLPLVYYHKDGTREVIGEATVYETGDGMMMSGMITSDSSTARVITASGPKDWSITVEPKKQDEAFIEAVPVRSLDQRYEDSLKVLRSYNEMMKGVPMPIDDGLELNPNNFMDKAKKIVRDYVNEHLDKSDTPVEFEVYVVWFSKTLKNWKGLLSTTLPDQMYYEVTYNGHDCETYLDAYKKLENRRIPDYTPDPDE